MPDALNVNHELMRNSLVLVISEICAPGSTVLERLEKDARKVKNGPWRRKHN
jgi:hypothetical protein